MVKRENILVFPAHPDDEGSAWATLYKYFEYGSKISIAWMTNGDRTLAPIGKYVNFLIPIIESFYSKKAGAELSKRIALIRKKEALKVAQKINATPYFLEFKDTKVPSIENKDAIFNITDLIRMLKPSIILTHWFQEMHRDHKNTSALVLKSYLLSNDTKYITNHPPHKVRFLGFWDERGKNFEPNFYINVSNQIDRIKEWGKLYESQAFRIVGRFAKFKARKNSKNTPYNFVERFRIVGIKNTKNYGEFFPQK
ncbi:MAG: PIG-L deacetylase family protein [Candidatus Helarchaeota archaeon]